MGKSAIDSSRQTLRLDGRQFELDQVEREALVVFLTEMRRARYWKHEPWCDPKQHAGGGGRRRAGPDAVRRPHAPGQRRTRRLVTPGRRRPGGPVLRRPGPRCRVMQRGRQVSVPARNVRHSSADPCGRIRPKDRHVTEQTDWASQLGERIEEAGGKGLGAPKQIGRAHV